LLEIVNNYLDPIKDLDTYETYFPPSSEQERGKGAQSFITLVAGIKDMRRPDIKNAERHSALVRFFAAERRVWRGQAPLRTVFWGYGVVASSVIAALFFTAFDLHEIALQQGLILVSACYCGWLVVGLWRCAPNAAPFWRDLTRLLSVAWALNAALVLSFLQFDLLVYYLRM